MSTTNDDQIAVPVRGGVVQRWGGRVLSGLVATFLAVDGVMKLIRPQIVIDTMAQIRWPSDAATLTTLGIVQLAATLLYILPRTGLLGAILLTGYLGGAIATHARIGSPLFTHVLFGVYVGAVVWVGLWLRDPRLRAFLF